MEADTDVGGPPDYNNPILMTPTLLNDIILTRETILGVYFKKLFDFSKEEGFLYRKYIKFLYLVPVMDPDNFIFVTRRLLDLADATIYLIVNFCYYMALGMKKMTIFNQTLTHHLKSAGRLITRAMDYVEHAAEELRVYKEEHGDNEDRAFKEEE
ncbi:hypothetical protein M378DRAFT_17445 [Amanita muscaria Koide BX008]|uniref:Uncharacterized protein n=1 Tax=Amanita muscaria (strain Koide BX008) TaxID=946122 RepID=A0A0C2WIU1_AMAMK|nr:hypothetical protein M378DRAFT_17445 [Amanita muscaria Koide BX008]